MHHLETFPLQSHLVTLHSEKGQASNFMARLPKTLKLPRGYYNVGLLEMRCFQVDIPESEKEVETKVEETPQPAQVPQQPPPPLFPGIQTPTVETKGFLYTQVDEIVSLQINFNRAMADAKAPIQLAAFYISATEAVACVRITHTDVNKYIVLSEDLALALGFRRRCFYLGRYMGESVITKDNLSLLVNRAVYEDCRIPLQG